MALFFTSLRRKRVGSQDLVDRAAVLTGVVTTRSNPSPPSDKASHDAPDGSNISSKREDRPCTSSRFLDLEGYHRVLHGWKREEQPRPQNLDLTDGDIQAENTNLFSPMSRHSRHSRIVSDGSEDVFEPNPPTDVYIEMEEDRNEEQRRIQANYKWNLRRQKIEHEFLRLRHLSINKSRAVGGVARLRHSVSFGDDLEIQLEQSGMRELETDLDDDESKASNQPTLMKRDRSRTMWLMGPNSNKPYGRCMSMPNKDFDDKLHSMTLPGARVPSLETHEEFKEEEEGEEDEEGEDEEEGDEEEGEEEEGGEEEGEEGVGMLGLPPKDIPNLSMEQLDWAETDNDDLDDLDD